MPAHLLMPEQTPGGPSENQFGMMGMMGMGQPNMMM